VGVGTDAKIKGIKILENTDTPGLGGNAGSKTYYMDRARGIHFYDQFMEKPVGDPFVPKQDIVAITSATITSTAISASVKAAGEAALNWMRKSGRL
jgi:electron transport complex protein RnfG